MANDSWRRAFVIQVSHAAKLVAKMELVKRDTAQGIARSIHIETLKRNCASSTADCSAVLPRSRNRVEIQDLRYER